MGCLHPSRNRRPHHSPSCLCTLILMLRMQCKASMALILLYEPLSQSAVIEVTAGGSVVTTPTYRFSDSSGHQVASLSADVANGKITASGVFEASDVQTTSGASLNGKMDAMTVDSTPVDGSSNLVESNGVYDALYGKLSCTQAQLILIFHRTCGVMATPHMLSSHAMASIVLAFLELQGRATLVIVHTGSLECGKRKSSQP